MPALARTLLLIATLALAACDVQTNDENGDNVHISMGDKGSGDHVSLNVPGFNANLNIPGLNLGGHMDLDGVKIAPDSKVKGMDVFGSDKDEGGGQVHIAFTNPGDPVKMLDYYRGALKNADFAIGASTGDSIAARKDEKTFTLKVSPDGSGSKGMITISGE